MHGDRKSVTGCAEFDIVGSTVDDARSIRINAREAL
jgi:hypothetical protein